MDSQGRTVSLWEREGKKGGGGIGRGLGEGEGVGRMSDQMVGGREWGGIYIS